MFVLLLRGSQQTQDQLLIPAPLVRLLESHYYRLAHLLRLLMELLQPLLEMRARIFPAVASIITTTHLDRHGLLGQLDLDCFKSPGRIKPMLLEVLLVETSGRIAADVIERPLELADLA